VKKIRIKITEDCGCSDQPDKSNKGLSLAIKKVTAHDSHDHGCDSAAPEPANSAPMEMPNAHNGQESRMHRTTLAHLMADVKVLLDFIQDEDDLPEWLETKITKAGDYMQSAARYIAGNIAREQGSLEETLTPLAPMKKENILQFFSSLSEGELAILMSLADQKKKHQMFK
tara:strand:+ start:1491 stop:2003 length:513 start_codon:yes stop_codon:yes gene_type:complete